MYVSLETDEKITTVLKTCDIFEIMLPTSSDNEANHWKIWYSYLVTIVTPLGHDQVYMLLTPIVPFMS